MPLLPHQNLPQAHTRITRNINQTRNFFPFSSSMLGVQKKKEKESYAS